MSEPVNCRCGGEAEIFHIAPEGYEGSYCVRCTECLIQTPFFNKDKDKAIEVWNTAMHRAKVYILQNTLKDKSEMLFCPYCGNELELE